MLLGPGAVCTPVSLAAEEPLPILDLGGEVGLACHIKISAKAAGARLDLTKAQVDVLVAEVREICNQPTGYTVTVSSAGNGRLTNGDDSGVAYELKYENASPDLSASRGSPVPVTIRSDRTSADGEVKTVRISHRSASDGAGGEYVDTLVFTITPH